MGSIPISQLVQVVPQVQSSGGAPIGLLGLALTQSAWAPVGVVLPFSGASGVSAYFGPLSAEYAFAQKYFAASDTSNITPPSVSFVRYPEIPVAAWIRSGLVSNLSLTALQALTGSLTLTIDGLVYSAADIVLTTATSFSAAAALIQTALNAALPTGGAALSVVYGAVQGSFVIKSGSVGATSTAAYATGTLAAGLALTAVTGAVLSQGADAATPGAFMDAIVDSNTSFFSFTSLWEATTLEGASFSAWTTTQKDRIAYVNWNTDAQGTVAGSTSTLAYEVGTSGTNSSGTSINYAPVNSAGIAAMLMGFIAAIDFTQANGSSTAAFKTQSGLPADVTSSNAAKTLLANGINFYGSYANPSSGALTLYMNGQITGPYAWLDAYVNQAWMNASFQQAAVIGLMASKSVPYTPQGRATMQSWFQSTINQALNFGAISPGVNMSAAEIMAVNTAAGLQIDLTLAAVGYYLQILPPTAQVRGARTTPPCTFWYCFGGSVQQISLASVAIQ